MFEAIVVKARITLLIKYRRKIESKIKHLSMKVSTVLKKPMMIWVESFRVVGKEIKGEEDVCANMRIHAYLHIVQDCTVLYHVRQLKMCYLFGTIVLSFIELYCVFVILFFCELFCVRYNNWI